ncbi:MAG: hypothetical protein SPF83_02715 [Butyricimonas virosa]|uniref:hypothetical protein n=1 Tax=Butyricimonas virosa TaxID=544645 RepID=UPI002A9124DB|nr:hypothetical protein [Butyricimonas virosa]MDY5532553.1 hypothetical protein [Butyricimonas virosa]
MFRTCKVGGKNTEALRGKDDFSTPPGGFDLTCTKEHGLPLPVSYGNPATVWRLCPIWIFFNHREIMPRKFRYSREKHYLCRKIKSYLKA